MWHGLAKAALCSELSAARCAVFSSGNVELDHASSNVAFPARAPVCCFQVMLQQEARPETVSDQKSGGSGG